MQSLRQPSADDFTQGIQGSLQLTQEHGYEIVLQQQSCGVLLPQPKSKAFVFLPQSVAALGVEKQAEQQ